MATTIDIEPTRPALLQAILDSGIIGMPDPLTEDMIGVTSGMGRDPRNGWNTHIVTIKDWGVYGYTDGPLSEPKKPDTISADMMKGPDGNEVFRW